MADDSHACPPRETDIAVAAEAHVAYTGRRHFAGLNGIRCLAILAVIWHHAPHPAWMPIMTRGFFGVDLFFALSGFLIATLLIREKARSGRVSLKNFWIRRMLRLVPAYYFLLAALVVAYLVFKPGSPDTAKLVNGLPVYALYLSNWFHPDAPNLAPTWSLATEEQFYLVWPLVEAFAAPLVGGAIWLAAFVGNQLVNFGLLDGVIAQHFGLAPDQHPEILQTTFTPILLGVALAHLLHRRGTYAIIARIAGWRGASWAYALLLLALLNLPAADISGAFRLALHGVSALFIAAIILRPQGLMARGLESRVPNYIGTVSYGMYLYHLFCMHAATAIAPKAGAPWAIFILTALLTLLVSAVSYHVLEKPFLAMRSRFRILNPASDPREPNPALT